jgi:predicted ATP-grasp superfamily ATP-dependent carboligase
MLALGGRLGGKPVLISSADQYVSAIAANSDRLKEQFVFCGVSSTTQALLATKQRQYHLAAEHGLPVPRTAFVRSLNEALAFGAGARYPCLLKPVHFRDWERLPANHPLCNQKIALMAEPAELEATYRFAAEASPELVIQEIIEGPDTAKLVYLSCYAQDGRRIAHCMVRELRTRPIYFGSASVVEPVSDPEADRLCDGFLRGIGYVGICEIELKRDTRDGSVKMIEANPRYSVTADAAPYAGVDIGWLHYLDLIGKTVTPVGPSHFDFRHVVLNRDVPCIGEYRRHEGMTWAALIRSYRPPLAFFDFDWRDRRVTAATLNGLGRYVVGRMIRRVFPNWRKQRATAG